MLSTKTLSLLLPFFLACSTAGLGLPQGGYADHHNSYGQRRQNEVLDGVMPSPSPVPMTDQPYHPPAQLGSYRPTGREQPGNDITDAVRELLSPSQDITDLSDEQKDLIAKLRQSINVDKKTTLKIVPALVPQGESTYVVQDKITYIHDEFADSLPPPGLGGGLPVHPKGTSGTHSPSRWSGPDDPALPGPSSPAVSALPGSGPDMTSEEDADPVADGPLATGSPSAVPQLDFRFRA